MNKSNNNNNNNNNKQVTGLHYNIQLHCFITYINHLEMALETTEKDV